MSDIGLVRLDQIRFHPHNIRTNLGDLRPLAASIVRYGIMQPVVVERQGGGFRLRAGHRRVAAARIAGLSRVPAVIHAGALDDLEWIEQSIQENCQRADMDAADRVRAVEALRRYGCSWTGIADTFGVSAATIRSWTQQPKPRQQHVATGRTRARSRAVQRLIDEHPDEFNQLLAEEMEADVDEVVVQRAMDGQPVQATKNERLVIIARWTKAGRSLNELQRIQQWNVWRDLRESAA